MDLQAKYRLRADPASDSADKSKRDLNDKIGEKQDQVDNLKHSMPSRQNRTSMSPQNRINIQKQVNDKKGEILNLRQKKTQYV